MNDQEIRALFMNYNTGGDLNMAIMAFCEELQPVLMAKHVEEDRTLPDIVNIIAKIKSRFYLFTGVTMSGQFPLVPMSYFVYFDELREMFISVVRYARDNYKTMDSWFRERFLLEHLEVLDTEVTKLMEEPSKLPANTRGLNLNEIKLQDEVSTSVLIGILGVEPFQRYAQELNDCLRVLRQCQAEIRALEIMPVEGNQKPH